MISRRETTQNTKANEVGEAPTQSAKINSSSLRFIVLTDSSPNNEIADNSDRSEEPATLGDSLYASIRLNGTPQSSQLVDQFGDRERTEKRYKKAVQGLEESIKHRQANWESLELPDFAKISENDLLPQLRQEIKKILDARESSIRYQSFWSKAKHIMERAFVSTSPFAKNLLFIAKEGSSVLTQPMHY